MDQQILDFILVIFIMLMTSMGFIYGFQTIQKNGKSG